MNRSQTLSYTSSAISIYHNKNGGGKIVHVKEGLTAKRIWEYENIKTETIYMETTRQHFLWN